MSSTLLLPPPGNSFVIGPAVINTHFVADDDDHHHHYETFTADQLISTLSHSHGSLPMGPTLTDVQVHPRSVPMRKTIVILGNGLVGRRPLVKRVDIEVVLVFVLVL
jgi:hypothetical protein